MANRTYQLQVRNFGPVKEAQVEFSDMTVFVGPQATGKSLVLQLFKLLLDRGYIQHRLKETMHHWEFPHQLLSLYFGEGMDTLYSEENTQITLDNREVDLAQFLQTTGKRKEEQIFYIPAQRVLSLRDGLTHPFSDYRAGDPFVLRNFSDKIHQLIHSEFTRSRRYFPEPNRLRHEYRQMLSEAIFGDLQLKQDSYQLQRRMVLSLPDDKASIPYLGWSAGQREFVPLLLGIYYLLPGGKVSRRGAYQWVIVEEPEMGLHPKAILSVMVLIFELCRRKYRVCLSTHSLQILDILWALKILQEKGGNSDDVLEMLDLRPTAHTRSVAKIALKTRARVYYFSQNGTIHNISRLDPDSEREEEQGWGGLTEFSGRISEVVAKVVNRKQNLKQNAE